MRIKINTIFSREFCDSYQYDVVRKIEKLLDEELSHRFQSDLIEIFDITSYNVCEICPMALLY